MNFGHSLAEKRDFLSDKRNLKEIRNKVNLITLETAQFGDADSVMSYLEEISDYITLFNEVINDYIITYPAASVSPPLEEVSDEDIQKVIKRIIEGYIYIFSGFFELAGTMLAKFYVKLLELEEKSPLFSHLLFTGMQFFLMKEKISTVIADIEEIVISTWSSSSDNIRFIYKMVISYYRSVGNGLPNKWGEFSSVIRNSLKRGMIQPDNFNGLALFMMSDDENQEDLRIALRSYLLKNKVEESFDIASAVREFNGCYSKAVSNREDTTNTTSLITGVYNIKKCLDESGFVGVRDEDAEVFVFNSIGMFKIIDEIFIGKLLDIDEFPSSIIRCVSYGIQQALKIHPDLINTYLVYQFIRKVVPFIEKRDCDDLKDAFGVLFGVFYTSPYLTAYMGTGMTKETLEEVKEFLPEGCYEEVEELIEKYSKLSEKDIEGKFQDAITVTPIIHPCFLPGGESNVVVDEWMMRCHLHDSPENPFNRRPLTMKELLHYNESKEEELKNYEKERKEFMA